MIWLASVPVACVLAAMSGSRWLMLLSIVFGICVLAYWFGTRVA